MNHKVKMAIGCLLVLVLVATLGLACAKEKEEGKVTIVIGQMSDLTGPAAPCLVPICWALADQVRYINEEDPIPGVELKVTLYDTKYDPSRAIPGYEWLKERGARVIFTSISEIALVIKPFAAQDGIPIYCLTGDKQLGELPSWVFMPNSTATSMVRGMIKWIAEEFADEVAATGEKLKIGVVGYECPYGREVKAGVEYAQEFPEVFEYVGSYLTPFGTATWAGEVEAFKDCDWIALTTPGAIQPATFAAEYRGKGYDGKFLGLDSLWAFINVIVDKVGWEDMDGTLMGNTWPSWSYSAPMNDHVEMVLRKYRPNEAENLWDLPGGIGGGQQAAFFLLTLRAAIERVIEVEGSAENFDGQDFYDTAVDFQPTLEGYADLGWTPTERIGTRTFGIWTVDPANRDDITLVEMGIPTIPD